MVPLHLSQLDGQPFPLRCLPFSRMAVKPCTRSTSTRCQFKLGLARPIHTHTHVLDLPRSAAKFSFFLTLTPLGQKEEENRERASVAAKNFASQTFLHIFSTKRMLVFHVCWLISFLGFSIFRFFLPSTPTRTFRREAYSLRAIAGEKPLPISNALIAIYQIGRGRSGLKSFWGPEIGAFVSV